MTSRLRDNWTRVADVRSQLQKLWQSGELLRHLIDGKPEFPLALRCKAPSSTEIADRFDAVRDWSAELRKLDGIRIEMREFSHRVFGANTLPRALWVDGLDDALGLIGRKPEAARFENLLARIRQRQPALLPWLARRPLRALALAEEFERLLDVVAWVQAHPRPGIYLRQVDLPGVHSKFIEAHRGLLAEWLDYCLPPEAVDATHTGIAGFVARYGFRAKPIRIRFRLLDPDLGPWADPGMPDISLDVEHFAGLDLPLQRVFITENETNFLAFPALPASLVIFGAGYGWEALARAEWLNNYPIYYWGDIDTHGFAILDQLRRHFPRVESLLMDQDTLMAYPEFWGEERDQSLKDLPRLTPTEQLVYDSLRNNRIRPGLRLEQEVIGFSRLQQALHGIERSI